MGERIFRNKKDGSLVEARQYIGFYKERMSVFEWVEKNTDMLVMSPHGGVDISVGDWVVRTDKGRFFVYSPLGFWAAFEDVEEKDTGEDVEEMQKDTGEGETMDQKDVVNEEHLDCDSGDFEESYEEFDPEAEVRYLLDLWFERQRQNPDLVMRVLADMIDINIVTREKSVKATGTFKRVRKDVAETSSVIFVKELPQDDSDE